jgi:DNA-binding transcriptional LysR family regulator
MQLRNFDLNLLLVFDAVFEEHSIAAASERLSLSQSAVSHALRRLRRALSDDLFVRDADGMRPTPKARQFAMPVKSALDRLASALGGEPFDPARAIRSFSIGASDYATTTVIPRLVENVASAAPSVDIYVVPANRVDMIRQLEEGNIDVAIGWFATVPERFGRTKLLDEDCVFVVRPGHPLTLEVPTMERLLDYRHVAVNFVGSDAGLMDGFLPERGVLRRVHMEVAALEAPQRLGKDARIAVNVPHFWCLPLILVRCDMIASVPRTLAVEFVKRFGLVIIPDLGGPTPVAVEAIWDRQNETDPAMMWLRAAVLSAARTLGSALPLRSDLS